MLDFIIVNLLRFVLIPFFGIALKPFIRKWVPGEKLKCLVYCYSGFNNTGGEVRTLEGIKQIRKALDNNVSFSLYTLNRKNTLRYIEEDDNLKVIQEYPLLLIKNSLLISEHDALILLEGSTFQDNFSSVLFWCYLYGIGLAQKLNKLTVAYAVDAREIKPVNRKLARTVINKLDLIMLRGEPSLKALQNLGVTAKMYITTDTAFNPEAETREWVTKLFDENGIDTSKPIIGIAPIEFFHWPVKIDLVKYFSGVKEDHYNSICYHSWGKDGKTKSMQYKKNIAEYADWCSQTYDASIVLIAMEGVDARISFDILNLMKNKSFVIDSNNYNSKQIISVLRNLNFLVSSRYHAIVLSMQSHIPFIGISNDGRIETIMKETNLYNDYYINYLDEFLFVKLKQKTENLNINMPEVREKIKSSLPAYEEKMNRTVELIKQAVNNHGC